MTRSRGDDDDDDCSGGYHPGHLCLMNKVCRCRGKKTPLIFDDVTRERAVTPSRRVRAAVAECLADRSSSLMRRRLFRFSVRAREKGGGHRSVERRARLPEEIEPRAESWRTHARARDEYWLRECRARFEIQLDVPRYGTFRNSISIRLTNGGSFRNSRNF